MGKKVFLQTYGCQMNEWDSQMMLGCLREEGWEICSSPQEADLLIVNTCSVRRKPEEKAFSTIGYFSKLKKAKPNLLIGVAGCMAQRLGEELLKKFPEVDFVIGTGEIHKLLEVIREAKEKKVLALGLNGCVPYLPTFREKPFQSYLPIIFGCNNFCSYCIVPFVRGRERSKPLNEVVEEVRKLAEEGVVEVILLGQNVNAYGRDLGNGTTFASLLYALNEVPIKRIKFTTSHPRDFSEEIIEAIASLPKVCHWIHLPIQAGDDKILKAMRRGYTVGEYLRLVDRIRERIPDVAITTDVMVGFPGEGEEEFKNTLKVFERVQFDQAFMFAYSPRPGTSALSLPGQVGEEEKKRRLKELITLQNAISRRKNEKLVGKVFEVLVEGKAPKGKGLLEGKSREHKTLVFPGDEGMIGKLVKVRAKEAYLWGFRGEIADE